MAKISAIIDDETKARFHSLAKTQNMTEAQFLRTIVFSAIESPVTSTLPIEPDVDDIDKYRIDIRIPGFLHKAIKKRAKTKGITAHRWIVSLIQSNLMKLPVSTQKELFKLESSNRELAAIGRNINQIARTLNESFHKTEAVRLETLSKLSNAIKTNRDSIIAVIRASKNVWKVED